METVKNLRHQAVHDEAKKVFDAIAEKENFKVLNHACSLMSPGIAGNIVIPEINNIFISAKEVNATLIVNTITGRYFIFYLIEHSGEFPHLYKEGVADMFEFTKHYKSFHALMPLADTLADENNEEAVIVLKNMTLSIAERESLENELDEALIKAWKSSAT
jgi:hypothetical protein